MLFLARFLALVVVLNLIRYLVSGPLEYLLGILPRLMAAMEESKTYFNTQFSSFDWITSYFYNFVLWLTISWVYVIAEPVLKGNSYVKSLKVYGLMWLAFASVSAIYMNHYRHPKAFYGWNVLDGVVAFGVVAIANGFLYPLLFKRS